MNDKPIRAQIVIFAKFPEAGAVKTRLVPRLTPEQAAELHMRSLLTTLDAVGNWAETADPPWNVTVAVSPDRAIDSFRKLLPAGLDLIGQGEGALGEKLRRVSDRMLQRDPVPLIFLGADSPTLPVSRLGDALRALQTHDAVIGPSDDGGYYLIGLRRPLPELFDRIDWSTNRVAAQTRQRAASASIRLAEIDPWYDVDRWEDLRRVHDDMAADEPAAHSQAGKLLDLVRDWLAGESCVAEGQSKSRIEAQSDGTLEPKDERA